MINARVFFNKNVRMLFFFILQCFQQLNSVIKSRAIHLNMNDAFIANANINKNKFNLFLIGVQCVWLSHLQRGGGGGGGCSPGKGIMRANLHITLNMRANHARG